MKILVIIFLAVSLYTGLTFARKSSALLVIDASDLAKPPRNFRTTSDNLVANHFSKIGLNKLHIMGSAQFSEKELHYVIQNTRHPAIIIDLRQEAHGFINGTAISWYGRYNWDNVDKDEQKISTLEKQLLQNLQKQSTVIAYQIKHKKFGRIKQTQPLQFKIHNVQDEQNLLKTYSINYYRIYVTDHKRPNDQQVDNFIHIVKTLPMHQWMYIHCRGGKGRTTIFMAMKDMMENAKQVSFADIVHRQFALGGQDLYKIPAKNEQTHDFAIERLQFLEKFYQYCKNNQNDFATNWSEWIQRKS